MMQWQGPLTIHKSLRVLVRSRKILSMNLSGWLFPLIIVDA
jgi:hypothetical protein